MAGMIARSQSCLEGTPVDALPKKYKWVVHVDQLLQINLEHLSLRVLRLLMWTH